MHHHSNATPASELFSRDPGEPSVLVADGYGLSLTVTRGHLLIRDGIGRHRRERRLHRAQRTVRRIVIIGHTGHISLEAVRWCTDTRIALIQLDTDGTVLLTAGAGGRDDARLRRSQAAAAGNAHGLLIAKSLLCAKMLGQAAVTGSFGLSTSIADRIEELTAQLMDSTDLRRCRDLEAQASNLYFGAWSAQVTCRFADRDRAKVPDHWTVFAARGSILHGGGRTPRSAADPINAMLNYGYALAEAETTLAIRALGLDPGLGIVHTDKPNRDSFALDLLEPLRPIVEKQILQLLAVRSFKHTDFHETPQGGCRLLPAITHELADQMPYYSREAAAYAEQAAAILAKASPSPVALRTPLTRSQSRASQTLGQRSRRRQPNKPPSARPSCRNCGGDVLDPKRRLCPSCWSVTRRHLATSRAISGQAALAALRAQGLDPTNTPKASAARSRALSQRKAEELQWTPPDGDSWTVERYRHEVLPRLTGIPLSQMSRALGLSVSASSRIRSGQLLPHRRHWQPLADLSTQGNAPVHDDQ